MVASGGPVKDSLRCRFQIYEKLDQEAVLRISVTCGTLSARAFLWIFGSFFLVSKLPDFYTVRVCWALVYKLTQEQNCNYSTNI